MNGGRRPQSRTGASPRTGFQIPHAVFLNIVRHLKLSEVAPSRRRRRLLPVGSRWYFGTWTPAVTSLLDGIQLVRRFCAHMTTLVPEPAGPITFVNSGCALLARRSCVSLLFDAQSPCLLLDGLQRILMPIGGLLCLAMGPTLS